MFMRSKGVEILGRTENQFAVDRTGLVSLGGTAVETTFPFPR